MRRVGEKGAHKWHCAAGRGGDAFGTLDLLDTMTCTPVAFFLPLLAFLVTCTEEACGW